MFQTMGKPCFEDKKAGARGAQKVYLVIKLERPSTKDRIEKT